MIYNNELGVRTRKLLHANNLCTKPVQGWNVRALNEVGMALSLLDDIHKKEILGLSEYIKEKGTKFMNWVKEYK